MDTGLIHLFHSSTVRVMNSRQCLYTIDEHKTTILNKDRNQVNAVTSLHFSIIDQIGYGAVSGHISAPIGKL